MRALLICAFLSAAFLAPCAVAADTDNLQGQGPQPAGYDPSGQQLCLYPTHEGSVIGRPICQSPHAWASQKEHNRQVFRDFLRQNLTVRHR